MLLSSTVKFLLIILGLAWQSVCAWAHDPYEVTAVLYVRSNVIELRLEMEFPTGMTLAGLAPSREVSAESQFEAGLSKLRELVGGFFEITAGNNMVQPLRTNMELGVEAHILGQLDFAVTDHRPLRLVPRGLLSAPGAPYGVSLTVLDMVHQKVMGQTTLFADSPPADFPRTTSPTANPISSAGDPVRRLSTTQSANALHPAAAAPPPRQLRVVRAVLVVGAILALVIAWRWSQARS